VSGSNADWNTAIEDTHASGDAAAVKNVQIKRKAASLSGAVTGGKKNRDDRDDEEDEGKRRKKEKKAKKVKKKAKK
jgi:hypothetical protein